jgi:molybdopterin-guanine dinucleotide biosynthesis protein A
MPSAAILAGGRARRFDGQDKSALVIDGQTILERQLTVLSEVSDDILLIGSRHPLRIPTGGVATRQIADRVADSGPLGGLDAGLAACRAETLTVVACDMPFIAAGFLRHLAALAADRPEVQAVVPRTKRGYHPLCAVYTRACAPIVARHLAERRLKLVELLDVLNQSGRGRLLVVEEAELGRFGDPDRLLANVNTPAEYEELEAQHDHRP